MSGTQLLDWKETEWNKWGVCDLHECVVWHAQKASFEAGAALMQLELPAAAASEAQSCLDQSRWSRNTLWDFFVLASAFSLTLQKNALLAHFGKAAAWQIAKAETGMAFSKAS